MKELPALSPRQSAVYRRLRRHKSDTGDMPYLSEFARDLRITYVTLKQHLEALHRKGYITFESRGRGRAPVIRLAEPEPTGFVWPTVWHPMTETPPDLKHGEVLVFAEFDGIVREARTFDLWQWMQHRQFCEDQAKGAYAWAVLRLPPSPMEVSDA